MPTAADYYASMSAEAICAPQSDHDGDWVGVRRAVETTARWTAHNLYALYGDAVFEYVAINPHSMLALARAIVDGTIGAQDAGEQRAATLGPLRSASSGDDPFAVGRALRPLQLNRGDFHSWLALAPLLCLCGEVAPAAAEPLKRHRRDVAPLEAVSMMIWGEVWSATRAQARLARAALVNGMLSDDAKAVRGSGGRRGSPFNNGSKKTPISMRASKPRAPASSIASQRSASRRTRRARCEA